MNPESLKGNLEQKLYIPRDVEGEPNRKELEIIRELEKELSKHPAFIGLSPYGSIVSGYSINSETYKSDIDLMILFDSEKIKIDQDYIDDYMQGIRNKLKLNLKKIRLQHFVVEIINVKEIINRIKSETEKKPFPKVTLSVMSQVIIGSKINDYREIIARELQKLSPEKQKEAIDKIVESLSIMDQLSLRKRKKRMPELLEQEHEEVLEKRKAMWKKRVEKIWGIKSEQ